MYVLESNTLIYDVILCRMSIIIIGTLRIRLYSYYLVTCIIQFKILIETDLKFVTYHQVPSYST